MLRVPGGHGHFLLSWMIFIPPKEDSLKILYGYLYKKCVRKEGSRRGGLGGHCRFLTRDMEDRVILNIMNDVIFTLRKIP